MILRRKKPYPFWLNDKNSFCCVLHCSSLFDQFVSLQTNHHYTFLQSIPRDLKVSLNWMQYPTSQNMADLVGDDFPEKKTNFHLGIAWMGGGTRPKLTKAFFYLDIHFKSEKVAQIACRGGGATWAIPKSKSVSLGSLPSILKTFGNWTTMIIADSAPTE